MRYIILHGHIFKNAGTTFDWSLKKTFGERFLEHREDSLMRSDGRKQLENLVNSRPDICAISSHNMTRNTPEMPGVSFIPVYLLRHPIERVWSVYNFERRQSVNTPGARAAKSKNFKDYVSWRMEPEVARTIRNYQTVYLAGCHGFTGDADVAGRCFSSAIESLQGSLLIGIVEQYDESMVVMEEALKNRYPEIDLSYIVQNASQESKYGGRETGEDAIARIFSELGGVQKKLIDANSFDLALYQAAVHRLNAMAGSVEAFSEKLEAFRVRCKRRLAP
jgi:hypothetical protein